MKNLFGVALLALGLLIAGGLGARAMANDGNNGDPVGCGFTIFCGWYYWAIQGSNGTVAGAGACYAGDTACIPDDSVNAGQPGDPCFENPFSDGCGNSGASSRTGNRAGTTRTGRQRR
jgi:hypothetical protein